MVHVYISIGSNQEPRRNIQSCLQRLHESFGELQVSTVYENEAVGFEGENFYNLVVGFDTVLPVEEVTRILHRIEDEHGRIRSGKKFSSRTLDLDLLLYGDLVLKTDTLQLPRDEINRYAFVLRPLAELAPGLQHPSLGKTMADLWSDFPSRDVMWPVDIGA